MLCNLLRFAFLVLESLLHAVRHFRHRVAFFGLLMDALETSLLLESHLLGVDANTAEVWHPVGLERWTLAFNIDFLLLVLLLGHAHLLSLPERERLLSLLSYLDRLLLHTHASLLVIVHDLLIAGDEDGGWHRLMPKLVLDHVVLFDLLLHHHLVHFALASVGLFGLLVPDLKVERLWNGDAIATFSG